MAEDKNYSVKAAGSWTIIQALSPELAREEMARRLGVLTKTWLHEAIVVREATKEDVERYVEMTDVGPKVKTGRNPIQERFGG